ncbi:magnesium transporter CorA family protein [Lederbergia wuyishanensis]|uniref:Mg2+ and Co2+ transporter CorA n=1 Tax=Lederbergia wuyishanensis TaxID=1347903 RepID=A0ABU0D8J7_9BACI|nr:magnesium transporter CorA family protein [Lederbergia wuyishanensis]MCJ8007696.1 magnesium transporter CorA family protein [Lederbergia wuyishanensis]MDQ0344720.1 Mg2+ and Co2+ transporter CorA [Lederbergia wuyishanensis]
MEKSTDGVHTFSKGWFWQEATLKDKDKIDKLLHDFPATDIWLNNSNNIKTNYLRVMTHGKENTFALIGSLNYSRDPENPDLYKHLHYYVSENKLLTIDFDINVFSRITYEEVFHHLEQCNNALDGFLFLLSELLNTFLDGIDDFEEKLITLEKTIRFNNQSNSLEEIFEIRSEMLFLTHLVIPIEEIVIALQEAYLNAIDQVDNYNRTRIRLERTMKLLDHYEHQIESLLNLNINLYSFRGNEIIKALTVFTVLVTPITVLGALWGMNFKYMPEFKWKLGYIFAWCIIILTTGLIYVWLYKKGWTGDILKRNKKNKS